jgi:hypothetical protein
VKSLTKKEHRSIPVNVMRYTPLLLFLFVISAGAQQANSQSCSTVVVSCPDSDSGTTLTFSANVSGGDSAKLTFNWTVSAGRITAGQGTASITVDKTGFGGQSFTATVEVAGLPKDCPNLASCSTPIIDLAPPARKFDEYGDLSWAEERARLDKFANHLEPGIRLRSHRKKLSRKLSNPRNRIGR